MNNEVFRKLNFKNYEKKLILNIPDTMDDFEGLSFDVSSTPAVKYDLVFAFIFKLEEFTKLLNGVIERDLLNPNGFLFFAYPKKGNKLYNKYIGRDDFFSCITMDDDGFVNGSGLKFAKMIAFDNVFTVIGLKNQLKQKGRLSRPSQSVVDYVKKVHDLQKYWEIDQQVLAIFNKLTPGYQSDWARYVYSAKTSETISKRLNEMAELLLQGYKTKDLYRQKKKLK